jgi:hypothetical protein
VNFVTSPSNETGARRVGRPALRKKGAFTAAERQRRHRKKLRREQRPAELAAKRERHEAYARKSAPRYAAIAAEVSARVDAQHAEWTRLFEQPELPGANGPADEIARQIAEWLAQDPDLTLEDVRAAIDRRFGAR